MKRITLKKLKEDGACPNGIRWYRKEGLHKIDWDKTIEYMAHSSTEFGYVAWLCMHFQLSLLVIRLYSNSQHKTKFVKGMVQWSSYL